MRSGSPGSSGHSSTVNGFIGIALFVNEIAPGWVRRPIVYTIDLLAAIP